jgi:SAM-dependent methyltransferase
LASNARWRKAQAYERGFWEGVAQRAAEGSYDRIDFYEWRAGELTKRLRGLGEDGLLSGQARIVEMGSGPVGVLGFLPGSRRVAVDPLNGFYASNARLTELRNPEIEYVEAPGEAVPLPSGEWDLVIMENCIDHVQDVDAVMKEIDRLLGPRGLLYLTVNARSRPGYWMHRVLARFALDPGHPHTFTESRFGRMLERHGYDIIQFETTSWWEAWRTDLAAGEWKHRMKGILAVSEHLLTAVARKQNAKI